LNPLLWILLNQALIATCKGTPNFLIQVSQSKFKVLKSMSRKNFHEFMRFFLKGLKPFKIQASFKLDLFLEIITQNPEVFGSWDKKKICFFKLSITLPSLEIFRHQEGWDLYFWSLNGWDTRSWGNFSSLFLTLYHNDMPSKGLGIHTYRLLASQEYARC
jgi:hypothetical protein